MPSSRIRVFLAAHGERGGAANDARLAGLVDNLSREVPEVEIFPLRVSRPDEMALALDSPHSSIGLILPLLFSDGFFFDRRLRPAAHSRGLRLLPPFALWPGFADLLTGELARRLEAGSPGRLLLVAHGSASSSRSADCARLVAKDLAQSLPEVDSVFLEEPPLAGDVIAAQSGPWSAIGLFLGDGLHGREDFDAAIARGKTPPGTAFTVGECEDLAGFLAARLRQEIAAMGGS